MDSLCDPSTADVTGRVVEAFGLALEILSSDTESELAAELRLACARGLSYLRSQQEVPGSWFGRWGVNYIYGTSNVLCGLARLRVDPSDPMILHAVDWLKHVQNSDGGWGESLASYADKRWMGRGESTASQTAWALMALLNYVSPEDPSIERGVRWLITHQKKASDSNEGQRTASFVESRRELRGGTWDEPQFTGTGFPNHFYLRYHLYRHYFPMMALGRYLRARLD